MILVGFSLVGLACLLQKQSADFGKLPMEGKEQVCEWLETKVPLGSSVWQRIAYKMTNLPKCDLFWTFYWPTERNPNNSNI